MSVYLCNLIFSLYGSNVSVGQFQPYPSSLPPSPSISNVSSAWFEYLLSPDPPPGLGSYLQVVTQALNPSDWGNVQNDSTDLTLDPGDYLMIRISCADSNVNHYQTRMTGVFGRGSGQNLAPGGGNLQSPLVMSTPTAPSTFPRAVIDVDQSVAPSWPAPIAADGSWVTWLGEVYVAPGGLENDYTLNLGASVYVNANPPSTGNLYTFGHDPRMHVGGIVMPGIVAA
jgi:hypothetical protein